MAGDPSGASALEQLDTNVILADAGRTNVQCDLLSIVSEQRITHEFVGLLHAWSNEMHDREFKSLAQKFVRAGGKVACPPKPPNEQRERSTSRDPEYMVLLQPGDFVIPVCDDGIERSQVLYLLLQLLQRRQRYLLAEGSRDRSDAESHDFTGEDTFEEPCPDARGLQEPENGMDAERMTPPPDTSTNNTHQAYPDTNHSTFAMHTTEETQTNQTNGSFRSRNEIPTSTSRDLSRPTSEHNSIASIDIEATSVASEQHPIVQHDSAGIFTLRVSLPHGSIQGFDPHCAYKNVSRDTYFQFLHSLMPTLDGMNEDETQTSSSITRFKAFFNAFGRKRAPRYGEHFARQNQLHLNPSTIDDVSLEELSIHRQAMRKFISTTLYNVDYLRSRVGRVPADAVVSAMENYDLCMQEEESEQEGERDSATSTVDAGPLHSQTTFESEGTSSSYLTRQQSQVENDQLMIHGRFSHPSDSSTPVTPIGTSVHDEEPTSIGRLSASPATAPSTGSRTRDDHLFIEHTEVLRTNDPSTVQIRSSLATSNIPPSQDRSARRITFSLPHERSRSADNSIDVTSTAETHTSNTPDRRTLYGDLGDPMAPRNGDVQFLHQSTNSDNGISMFPYTEDRAAAASNIKTQPADSQCNAQNKSTKSEKEFLSGRVVFLCFVSSISVVLRRLLEANGALAENEVSPQAEDTEAELEEFSFEDDAVPNINGSTLPVDLFRDVFVVLLPFKDPLTVESPTGRNIVADDEEITADEPRQSSSGTESLRSTSAAQKERIYARMYRNAFQQYSRVVRNWPLPTYLPTTTCSPTRHSMEYNGIRGNESSTHELNGEQGTQLLHHSLYTRQGDTSTKRYTRSGGEEDVSSQDTMEEGDVEIDDEENIEVSPQLSSFVTGSSEHFDEDVKMDNMDDGPEPAETHMRSRRISDITPSMHTVNNYTTHSSHQSPASLHRSTQSPQIPNPMEQRNNHYEVRRDEGRRSLPEPNARRATLPEEEDP